MKTKLKKLLCFVMTIIMLVSVCSACLSVFAEGSKELNLKSDSNTGYRFYTEQYNKQLSGIDRKVIVKCYLFKGETAYFGSSVYNSLMDKNGNKKSSPTGADIVMTKPDSTTVAYDVLQNGVGYISSTKQEQNGPKITSADANISDKYIPLSYVAETEGIYTFEFHSTNSTGGSVAAAKKVNESKPEDQKDFCVAFWDITVKGTNDEIKTGRIWTNYLSLTTGSGTSRANLEVYVLTADGYIYKVHFKDIAPFGFVFFANNQGFTTTGITPYSIYHSFYDNDNDLKEIENEEYITFHKPYMKDTDLAKTFKIFFEYPNQDLIGKIYNEPTKVESIQNLTFHGQLQNHGAAYYGHGGYFTFNSIGATSTTITIDFRDSIEELKNEGKLDGDFRGSGIVELNGAVVDGENKFYWDGKDTTGVSIPVGDYGKNKINIVSESKSGEVHFPFIDVEGIYGGVIVERMNGNNDGEHGKYDIYYNNNPLVYRTIEGEGHDNFNLEKYSKYITLSDGTKTHIGMSSDYYGKIYFDTVDGKQITKKNISTLVQDTAEYIYDKEKGKGAWDKLSAQEKAALEEEYKQYVPTFHHEPNDSSKDTILFSNENISKSNPSGYYGAGNQSGVDIWTYYSDGVTSTDLKADMQILAAEDVGTISGKIFYDEIPNAQTKPNGKYDTTDGDYLLRDVAVELVDKNGDPITIVEERSLFDENGYFVRDEDGKIVTEEREINFRTTTDIHGAYKFTGVPIVQGEDTEYYVHVLLSPVQVLVEDFKLSTTVEDSSKNSGPDGNLCETNGLPQLENEKTVFSLNNSQKVTLSSKNKAAEFKDIGYVSAVPTQNQMNYKVVKNWPNGTEKLSSVTVKLYNWDPNGAIETGGGNGINSRTGELIETVRLYAANNWSYTWRHLDKNRQYYFVEYYTKTDDAGKVITNDRGEEHLVLIGGTMPIYSVAPVSGEKYDFVLDSENEARVKEYFGDGITHTDATTNSEKATTVDNDALLYNVTYNLKQDTQTKTNIITLTNSQSFDERQYYVWLDHEAELPDFVATTLGTGVDSETGKKKVISETLKPDENGNIEGMTITTLDSDLGNTKGDATELFFYDEAKPTSVKYTATDHHDYPEGTGTRTYKVEYDIPDDGDDTVYSWTLTIHVYDVNKDVYVFDYGLKAELQKAQADDDTPNKEYMLLSNDVLRVDRYKHAVNPTMATCADFTGISYSPNGLLDDVNNLDAVKALGFDDTYDDNDAKDGTASATGKNGNITVSLTHHRHDKILNKGDDHANYAAVTFTPTKFMSEVEVYYYQIVVFSETIANKFLSYDDIDATNGVVMYAPIIVAPASTVYYEDGHRFSNEYTGTAVIDGTNHADDVYQSINQKDNYGYDDAYLDPNGTIAGQYDSLGGSTNVKEKASKFSFEFEGTGFDILGRTDSTAAKITYRIDKWSDDAGKYKLYKAGTVDASYVDTNGSALYQLPVISVKNLPYDKYKITSNLATTSTDVYHFNFDGVRIYNPLGENGCEYYLPSENKAQVTPVRDMILGSISENELANGFAPSDATASLIYTQNDDGSYNIGSTVTEVRTSSSLVNHSEDLRDYLSAGPKGELYIPSGSGIAFKLEENGEKDKTLQIEAKAIFDQSSNDETNGYGWLENVGSDQIIEVNSSTSMYYELDTSAITSTNQIFVLVNNSDHTISVSNIKCKGFTISYPQDFAKPIDDPDSAKTQPAEDWSNDRLTAENIIVKTAGFATSYARAGRETHLNVTILEPITDKNKNDAKASFVPYYIDKEGNAAAFDGNPVRHFKTNYTVTNADGTEESKPAYAFVYKIPITAPQSAGNLIYTVGAISASEVTTQTEDGSETTNYLYSENAWLVGITVKSADISPDVSLMSIAPSNPGAPKMMRAMLVADETISTDDTAWYQDDDMTIYADYEEEGEYSVLVKDIDGYESVVSFKVVIPNEKEDDSDEPQVQKTILQKIVDAIKAVIEFLKKFFKF